MNVEIYIFDNKGKNLIAIHFFNNVENVINHLEWKQYNYVCEVIQDKMHRYKACWSSLVFDLWECIKCLLQKIQSF